ncbi:MAG: NAD+ synthase [Thermoplasmata archaeon]
MSTSIDLVPHLPVHARATIDQFLRHQVRTADAAGIVLGLSGGIDSALAARLAADAVGGEKVLGVQLPDDAFPTVLLDETRSYAHGLGIEERTIAISGLERAARAALPDVQDRVAWGNAKARLRMLLLYATARERRALVLGTGNKSELLLGYFTKYGDGGVDLLPLGDLYKTQVRELAKALGLPDTIRQRPPTAGLWEGQTDEGELGLPYADLDRILFGLEELRCEAEIAQITGLAPDVVRGVRERVDRHRHKRRPPPIPKVGRRTIGIDWRD